MQRFFVSLNQIDGVQVTFDVEQSAQISRVLRMNPGDSIVALDNKGWEYLVTLISVHIKLVVGRIDSRSYKGDEDPIFFSLFISMLKKEAFEWMLQKTTELGVSRIIPIKFQRTDIIGDEWSQKQKRWNRIIKEASEQCERIIMPVLELPLSFKEAMHGIPSGETIIVPWERATGLSLIEHIHSVSDTDNSRRMNIFIGPAGGIEENEIELARQADATIVSLGKRILRSETAAVVATAIVIQILEEPYSK
jgi:16S rRNA (uracil1498-N3)-methyltransferase